MNRKRYVLREDEYDGKKTDTVVGISDTGIWFEDWECSNGIEDFFGKEDIEWYYHIDKMQIEKLLFALKSKIKIIGKHELSNRENEFYKTVSDNLEKELLRYVFSYFRTNKKAIWLIEYLKNEGIDIEYSSI